VAEVKGTVLPEWLEDTYFNIIRSKPVRALLPSVSDLGTAASLGWNETEGRGLGGMLAGSLLETTGIPGIGYIGSRMAEMPIARMVDDFLPIERMVRKPELFNIYHGTSNMDDLVRLQPRTQASSNVFTDGFYGTGNKFMSAQYGSIAPGGGVGLMTGRMNRPFDFNKKFSKEEMMSMLKSVDSPTARNTLRDISKIDDNVKIDGESFLTYMKYSEDPTPGGLFNRNQAATNLLDDLGFDGVVVGREGMNDIQIFLHPEKQLSPGWTGMFQPGKVKY